MSACIFSDTRFPADLHRLFNRRGGFGDKPDHHRKDWRLAADVGFIWRSPNQ
jgi:hypothetical protein